MTGVKEIRNKLERLKGQKEQIKKDIVLLVSDKKKIAGAIKNNEEARQIIKEVGIKTQEQLQYHIGDITSLALEAVFPDPYQLELEFTQRRDKTECDIYFVRDEERTDPIGASGGGAVDIASFALRIASWSLKMPHFRNVIILDEPMKNLSKEFQERASKMLQEVSRKLEIQFIIVTHEPALSSYSDKIIGVGIKNKISKVIMK